MALGILTSGALAAQSLITPIPQDTNYAALASVQIFNGNFSSDPTQKGRIAATSDDTEIPKLAVFIINNDICVSSSNTHSYKIVVQNIGTTAAQNLLIQDTYPTFTTVTVSERQTDINTANSTMTWREDGLSPGSFLEYSFTLTGNTNQAWTNFVTVQYDDSFHRGPFTTSTQHTLPNNCNDQNSDTGPLPAKQAAIICDPAETSCVPFLPNLGIKFPNALSAVDGPDLGKRFREAVADIIPGECKVQADDVISDPAYQDALKREGKPAAYFMDPLFQSGQDFKRLVQENELLGITNTINARDILQRIHTKYWDAQKKELQKVLNDQTTTDTIRNKIQGWRSGWIQETQQTQQNLATEYVQMQTKRKEKFDPIAEKAIENAKLSMQRACGENSDGGLAPLLPPVKEQYLAHLDDRIQAYVAMQQIFIDPENALFPVGNRASTWVTELNAALDAFDQGNPTPLEKYIFSIPDKDTGGFNTALRLTYQQFAKDDQATDELIRLQAWEIALDTPKTAATKCEAKKVFHAPVETTWCESGSYKELFGPEAQKIRQQHPNALPANTSGISNPSIINNNAVKGQACGGKPGDPYWAVACQCHCDQQVPTGAVDGDGNPIMATCQAVYPIVFHDIYITSQAECRSDRAGHEEEDKQAIEKAPF